MRVRSAGSGQNAYDMATPGGRQGRDMRIRLRRTTTAPLTLDKDRGAPAALHGTVITREQRTFAVGGKRWGILRCRPVAVTVERPGAAEPQRIRIPDPTLRTLGLITMLTVAVHIAVFIVARRYGDES